MARWIARLVLRPLRSDGRWLFPILLSASIALASLVPVESLHTASEAEFGQYSVRVLGADFRIEVNSLDSAVRPGLSALIDWSAQMGAQVGRVYEFVAKVQSSTTEAPIRIIAVGTGSYPYYGGEFWSVQPAAALEEGLAISTNAAKNLAVGVGDQVMLGNVQTEVAATFPENLLTMVAAGSGGTAVVAAGKIPLTSEALGGAEVVVLKLPGDAAASRLVSERIRDTLGKAGVLGSEDVAPAVEVGLARLKQAFLWCGLLILYMCAFGLAFGVEDYMNAKGDEIATLKVLGFSPRFVGFIFVLRLTISGVLAGFFGAGLGWSLGAVSSSLVGVTARTVAQLIRPSAVPWHLLLVGPVLVLVFGALPLIVRLQERPHQVLWGKMRGFPLAVRTGTGISSLISTLLLSVPVTLGLATLYLGPGTASFMSTVAVLLMGILVLVAVGAMIWLLSTVGKRLSVRTRWAFTYLSMGRGRLVASAGAIAFALAIGSMTIVLDRAITWEVQAAVTRQVPFSVCALVPHGELSPEDEENLSRDLSSLPGVKGSAYCDVGWAYGPSGTGFLVKGVRLDEASMFGSTLGEHAAEVPYGSIPSTIWEERVKESQTGQVITITLGTTATSGPQGKPISTSVVGLDPRPGLRVGLNAPLTVPEGTLDILAFRFLGLSVDPAYTFEVSEQLKTRLPADAEVYDFGPIEVMLRSAAEELSFLWKAVASFALVVSIVTYLTTSSVSRVMRSYEIALLRTVGVVGWRLRVGPYAEALTQGVISGLVAVLVAYLAVYQGLRVFINIDFSMNWAIPLGVIGLSVLISLTLQIVGLRANLRRSALETLRSE